MLVLQPIGLHNGDMARTPEEARRREQVAAIAARLLTVDFEALKRPELPDDLDFREAGGAFRRIRALCENLDADTVELITSDSIQNLAQFLEKAETRLGEIKNFKLSVDQPMRARNELIRSLDTDFRELAANNPSLLVLAMFSSRRRQVQDAEAKAAIDQIRTLSADATAELEKTKTTALGILDGLRQAAGKTALAKYSAFFNSEATAARSVAKLWLLATALVGATTMAYLAWLVFWWANRLPDYSVIQAIQSGGAKIALFSVAFYVLGWCGRNFKAQWHLHVVNKHRENALNALEAFAESAREPSTREAILIHASSAIFAQVQTGFVPDQADSTQTPSVLEIIRGGGS